MATKPMQQQPVPTAPRAFPNGSQYSAALQNTALCFRHPDLKGAAPTLDRIGLPRPISGNFASVFSVTSTSGRRYAVKCFTRQVKDQETRYHEISKHLSTMPVASLSQPWKMGFDYLPEGILVEGQWYPLLKMEWVEGISLSRWLEANHRSRGTVAGLADHFAALTVDLHRAGMAHGDLQHGNLLVAPDSTLRLVDYDGLYVPSLAGLPGTEMGHRNYQSPMRGADDFGPAMDRFSSWVIYLSLVALAADPGLWAQLHEPDSEYLILAEDDFKDPAGSSRFPALLRHTDPSVRNLADLVRTLAAQPLHVLPDLDTLLARTSSAQQPTTAHTGTRPGTSSAPSARPRWMDGHLPAESTTSTAQEAFAGDGYRCRRSADVLLAMLMPLGLLLPWILAAVGLLGLGPEIDLLAGTAGLAAAGAVTGRRTRRESRALRNEQRSLNQLLALAENPAASYARLDHERTRHEQAENTRLQRLTDQQRELTHQLNTSHARIESDKNAAVAKLDRELAGLALQRQQAIERALVPLQLSYIEQQLRRCAISSAQLPGIGPKTIRDLATRGIRTAADFTGIRIVSSNAFANSSNALLLTANGSALKITGVGPQKASTLDGWRRHCEASAKASCRIVLPFDQQNRINGDFAFKEQVLKSRRQVLEAEAQKKRQGEAERVASDRTRLADESQQALGAARAQQLEFDRRVAEIRSAAADLGLLTAARDTLRLRGKALSSGRYLRFLYLGR
ncbi:hypothetical protein ABUW04_28045 [Streptacidiphilus sp. N1-10]|uniref:Protein kinase domain-containing protein n=1 Tax=Streptacidiphilus jeojiensis TaxID=3229225 RepID=A0ABV6XV33_9ACTN